MNSVAKHMVKGPADNSSLGKYRISQPGDALELEADRIADEVLRMPEAVGTNFAAGTIPLQRKCAACEAGGSPCPACSMSVAPPLASHLQGQLQRKPIQEEGLRRQPVEEETEEMERTPQLRPAAVTTSDSGSLRAVEAVRDGGSPLPEAARGYFEPRFGVGLGGVRVHTGEAAARATSAINARAFTLGNDIVFAAGQYTPGATESRRLLAHELAHVVQNGPQARATPTWVARAGTKDQEQATSMPEQPDLDRMSVVEVLDLWRIKASESIDGCHHWQLNNWIDYLGRTVSNPNLSLADHALAGIASTAIGNLLTEIGDDAIKNVAGRSAAAIGAAIGTSIEPGGGTAIGFVIGVLIESAASWVFQNITGKTEVDEAAADATERLRKILTNQHKLLVSARDSAMHGLEALVGTAKQNVKMARSQAELDKIATWALNESAKTKPFKNPDDLSLSNELLRIWVFEHAGDVGTAHGSTSQAEWSRAAAHVFKGGAGLEQQPTLMVYQTRAEWARAGLDDGHRSDEMLAEVNSLVASAGFGQDAAEQVRAQFHGRVYTFLGVDRRDLLQRYVDDHSSMFVSGPTLPDSDIEVRCTLDLSSDRGSVYVDEWKWLVKFPQKVILDEEGDGGYEFDRELAFDVWPTWG